jgi:hypothetical protein
MNLAVDERQGVLQPSLPLTEVVYAARGVVRLEDLTWSNFDPERVTTMAEYIGEIGTRMADEPRESTTKDSALHVFGRDFDRAEPSNLRKGLYFPRTDTWKDPKKAVVRVSEWYCDLDRHVFNGIVPFSTGIAVSPELYEAFVQNAPYFSNKVTNTTEKANDQDPVIEQVEDLAGESALYALINKHLLLEDYDRDLLSERSVLTAVKRSLDLPAQPRRIKNLETYRLAAVTSIQAMARIACKGLGFGTNQTQSTLNAIASNIHRSPDGVSHLRSYSRMAIGYNDAVRGRINQSIHGIGREIERHAVHAINNIDREYED